eukprot:jgi/Chlat1/6885/Chrsp51S06574
MTAAAAAAASLATPFEKHSRSSFFGTGVPERNIKEPRLKQSSRRSDTPQPHASLISEIREDVTSRRRSAAEVAAEWLQRLRSVEPQLNSFITVLDNDEVRSQAARIDDLLKDRNPETIKALPLAGVPVCIKDNLCTDGVLTTCGSKVLAGYRPPYDAHAVARLKAAGAVTANPWDVSRVPGGSSGGSASAVAARQCPIALGSDTGGSVRQPASYCGVVGLKPTYGRVSRYGLVAYASSLDVVGVLGTTVSDTAEVLQVIAGRDEYDSTSVEMAVPEYTAGLQTASELDSRPLQGMRVGIIKETMGAGVDQEVISALRRAAAHLEELGASVAEVSLPSFASGLPAYYVLAPAEASSNLARFDGVLYGPRVAGEDLVSMYSRTRATGFGPEVRTLIQRDYTAALQEYSVLLSPVAPTPAYMLGANVKDPLSMYAGDLMTVNVNLAGLPALAMPAGFSSSTEGRLPIGLQLTGRAFAEAELLRIGHIFEETAPWARDEPPVCSLAKQMAAV